MSDTPAWLEVCRPERTVRADFARYCAPLSPSSRNPIDSFLTTFSGFVTLGTPEALTSNKELGRLLLLGIVGATEHYFRFVLSSLPSVCPLARERMMDEQVSLGSIYYYGERMTMAVFRDDSLAGKRKLLEFTKNIAGLEVKKGSSLDEALEVFDGICQFRHAAVHAGGELSPGNIDRLKLYGTARAHIVVDFERFQESASICNAAVRAFNRALHQHVVQRWIAERLLKGEWKQDKHLFAPLYEIFHSHIDAVGRPRAYTAYLSLRPTVAKSLREAGSP